MIRASVPDTPEIPDHPFGFFQLIFFQYRVKRNIDAGAIQMRILAKLTYIIQRVAGSRTRTELGRTDIDGIGTVINRFNPAIESLAGERSSIGRDFVCMLLFLIS